ncbi:MAG: helix-turn-helix domain-containing protein [Syntrophobacteraceae bacterium]|nr:helix-turn-helix domain-containing protein [Syntrophobacteraceae bacterium]
MPGPKPAPIVLSEKQRDFLNGVVRREKSTQQQIRRCRVVLLAADGCDNCSIARRLNLTLQTVRRWRLRWQQPESVRWNSHSLHTVEFVGKSRICILSPG